MLRPTEDPIAFRFFNEIGIIEQLARTQLERNLPDGLKMPQFGVLNHPARLASAFQVTKGAMTNTLQRLEKRGLVRVIPDPHDGRAKLVSITNTGRDMRLRCVDSVSPLLTELLQALSDKEFASALPFLEKVRIYLDGHRS